MSLPTSIRFDDRDEKVKPVEALLASSARLKKAGQILPPPTAFQCRAITTH